MARKTVINDLKSVIAQLVPDDPLILPIVEPLAVNLAGVSYEEYSTDALAIATVWDMAIRRFDLDWAGLFIDDLFEFEPLGIDIARSVDLPFAVAGYLPATKDTLRRLRVPEPSKDGRMPMHLDAQARLRDKWGSSILISGSIAAPFTGLTLLYGIEQTMLLLHDDPQFLVKSMLFLEELAVTWGRAMIDAGADIIWLGDCSGSSRFIPIDTYRQLCMEPAKRVASALQQAGAMVIYHAGENRLPYLKAMAETGSDVLSVESGIDMRQAKNDLGSGIALIGNLDAVGLIWHGTPSQIDLTVRKMVAEVSSLGGHIVSAGEGIPAQTPAENVEAMMRAIRGAWKDIRNISVRGSIR